MIHKMATDELRYVRVSFELPSCLWADRIYVVGDFNDWNETATPMRQDRDGVWRATVELLRGNTYEFRYLIDGQWTSDSHADGFSQNRFGDSNSVIHATLPMATLPAGESHVKEILSMRTTAAHASNQKRQVTYPTAKRRVSA